MTEYRTDWADERFSAAERAHFAFLHSLEMCALTQRSDGIEVAHIRINSGMAMKPNWRHTLPLFHAVHADQEKHGHTWWKRAGFEVGTADDPRAWAERLSEVTGDPMAATALLLDMIAKADRPMLYEILRGASM